MRSLRITLGSLAATQAFGAIIAQLLRAGDRVFLVGELGTGKTTLARAIGAALDAAPPLTSPTFVLVSEHQGTLPIWHADAYRLPEGSDPLAAGIIDERHAAGITIIEWPDQLQWTRADQGAAHFEISLALEAGQEQRSALITLGDPERASRLRAALISAGFEIRDVR